MANTKAVQHYLNGNPLVPTKRLDNEVFDISRNERRHWQPRWSEYATWNDLNAGDSVKVSGERGDFKFVSVGAIDGEAIHVVVHGGVYGNITTRVFFPHRIKKVEPRKRGKKAEIVEDDE